MNNIHEYTNLDRDLIVVGGGLSGADDGNGGFPEKELSRF